MTCSASGHADDGGQEMVGEACMQLLPVQVESGQGQGGRRQDSRPSTGPSPCGERRGGGAPSCAYINYAPIVQAPPTPR